MKPALLLALALITAGPALGQEVLQNSDFSDGVTHWHGDCKPAGSDTTQDFISSSQTTNGALVELHTSTWTRMTQDIVDDKAAAQSGMVLTITYQTSPDFKFSDKSYNNENAGIALDRGDAFVVGRPGQVMAFVDVPPPARATSAINGNINEITIHSDNVFSACFVPSTDQKPQTFTAVVRPPPPTHDAHQTFGLIFPPGSGSIVITKISIAPGAGGTTPSPYYRPPGNGAPAPNP